MQLQDDLGIFEERKPNTFGLQDDVGIFGLQDDLGILEEEKEEGHWEGWIKPSLKSIPRITGAVGGAMAAFPAAGLAGYARLLTAGPEEAVKTIEEISSLPLKLLKTPEQEKSMGYILKPIEVITESAKWWGDKAEKKWGWQAGAIVASGIEAAVFLGLPALKVKLTKAIKAGRLAEAKKIALDLHKRRLQKLKEEPQRLKKLTEAEKEIARKEGLKGEPLIRREPELGVKTRYRPSKLKTEIIREAPQVELVQKPTYAAIKPTPKEVTLEALGTQQLYEKIATEIPRLKDISKKAFEAMADQVDVEARFKRIGAKETGFHAKAFFSQQAMHEEFGLFKASQLAKMVKHSKADLQQIPLLYENPKAFARLPKAEKARLKPAVEAFGKYFEDSLKEYKAKGGLQKGFKERIISEIEEMLTKDISEADRAGLVQALKDAKEMNFVHIPSALWFESFLGRDPKGGAGILRLLVKQQRKTLRIQDLIDREIIKPEQVNANDIIGNYARRKGRDMAILNLKNAALKEGMASLEPKEGYVKLPTHRAPALTDTHLHPILADYIGHELLGRGLELGVVGKYLSLSKMAAFINPLILPMYDTVQHSMLALLSKPTKVPFKHLFKGTKHYLKKDAMYWEALDNGIASKPYANPFETYKGLVEWTKKTKGQKVLKALETVFPQNTIKNMYNASWNTAWELDKMIRMGSYDLLIKKGFKPREAAQIAAKFHSDYASVPPHLRRMLNIPFFTPTFKITMGKLYTQMIGDAVKSSVKLGGLLGKIDPKAKVFAKGLLATAAIDQAFELFMFQLGFERDEWGRRYKRKVITEKGEEELMVTWSSPSNMFLKYLYRAKAATDPAVEKPMLRFIETNKWEIQPVWRVSYEIMDNDDGLGNEIYNEHDEWWVKSAKSFRYGTTHIIRLLSMLDKDKGDREGREQFAKECGQLLELATKPFTFKYVRSPEAKRKYGKMRALRKRFMKSLKKGNIDPNHYKVFLEKIDEILKAE